MPDPARAPHDTGMTAALAPRTGPRARLLTPPFVALTLAELAYFTADGVAILALPLHVTGPLGGSEAAAGLTFGAFAATALLARPVAGRLTDTVGRLPLMAAGAGIAAVGLALTAYAEGLAVMIGLRLLLGLGEAAFFVAAMAALADLAPPSRMGEALSYNSLGLYLGLTLGPPLGEQLIGLGGFRAAWLGAAGLAAAAVLLSRLVGETREPGLVPAPGRLLHVPAIAPGLGFLTSIVAMGGFLAFAALHAEETGLAEASLPLVVYGGTVVVGRIVFGRYVDRFPPLPLGAAALATMGTGLALLTVAPTPGGALAGSALTASGIVFSTPAFFSAIFATAGPAERGAAAGTASIAMDLGLAGGPLAVGLVAEQRGIAGAFAVCALVTFAGAAWTLLLARRASSLRDPRPSPAG
jgi:predicted MFS family arabinose efflux permease